MSESDPEYSTQSPLGSIDSPVPPTIVAAQIDKEQEGTGERVIAFLIAFSATLDPVRATDLANYSVTEQPPESPSPTAVVVPLSEAAYNSVTRTVLLILARSHRFVSGGRIIVNSSPPNGITDDSGTYLDGSGNGIPGSPAVLTILPGATGIKLS
jgi:hypothetical protein